jgi:hypothetical protein
MVFPYLKGFLIIKVWFSILFSEYLWCFCIQVFGILTSGIRALSLARSVGKFFFFFADFFGEEKEGRDIPDNLCIFMCKICRNGLYI